MTPTSPLTPGSSALLEPPHTTGGPATSQTAQTPQTAPSAAPPRTSPPPEIEPEPAGTGERLLVAIFVGVPFLALLAAIPLAWGWGLGWSDVVIGLAFYIVSGLGIAVGFHRYFTHGSFKATGPCGSASPSRAAWPSRVRC